MVPKMPSSFIFLEYYFLILLISLGANADVTVEKVDIPNGYEYVDHSIPCQNRPEYEPKILRVNETLGKKLTILLHPDLVENQNTFLDAMNCYFNRIQNILYVSFANVTVTDDVICSSFDKLSNRIEKSYQPLFVMFPQRNALAKKIIPPCKTYNPEAMTIQALIGENVVSLFIRSKNADYVIQSDPTCQTLFDSIGAILNPTMHTGFKFPYQPIELAEQKKIIKSDTWHTAALIGVIVGFLLLFIIPGIIVWRRVKSHQKQRDEDKHMREAALISKMEPPHETF